MKTEIYALSKDKIRIDRGNPNSYMTLAVPGTIAFSDGTVISVTYDGSFVRLHRDYIGSSEYRKRDSEIGDIGDHVTLHGQMQWVAFGAIVKINT